MTSVESEVLLRSLRTHVAQAEFTKISPIIIELLEVILLDITQLQSDIQDLQQAGAAASNELQTLAGQVAQLQASGPGNITQADLDSLAQSVSGVTQALKASTGSAESTSAPPPTTPTPSPTGTPEPGPTPAPGPTTGGSPVTSQTRPVYFFDGDASTVNTAAWPATEDATTDSIPKPLFNFANDTQNADGSWNVTGDGADNGQWHHYTGATQPTGTTASPTAPAGTTTPASPASPSPEPAPEPPSPGGQHRPQGAEAQGPASEGESPYRSPGG